MKRKRNPRETSTPRTRSRKYASDSFGTSTYAQSSDGYMYNLRKFPDPSSRRSSVSSSRRSSVVASSIASSRSDATPTPASRIAGAVVGAGVNYLMGNEGNVIPAAISGATNGLWSSSQNKMSTRVSVQNASAFRSKMVKTGKVKRVREKKVKVGKYLKTAIKQVTAGSTAKGFYQRKIQGLVGTCWTNAATDHAITGNGFGGTVTFLYGPGYTSTCAGGKTWFNGLMQGNDTATTSVQNYRDLNFFTPQKIWHAASVLFNGKTEEQDCYLNEDKNLSTVFVNATGATNGTAPGTLKVHVAHSKVEWSIKNLSNRNVTLDIYECQPTLKLSDSTALDSLLLVGTNVGDSSTADSIISMYNGTAVKTGSPLCQGSIDFPGIAKGLGWHWKYVKRTISLMPDETCMHIQPGPSGILDFQKLINQTTGAIDTNIFYKGWSSSVIISVQTDQTLPGGGTVQGSRLSLTSTTANILGAIVSIEATESMRISVPEIAGFAQQAIVAGSPQVLNFRKTKMAITDLTNVNGSVLSITSSRPENPTAEVLTGA